MKLVEKLNKKLEAVKGFAGAVKIDNKLIDKRIIKFLAIGAEKAARQLVAKVNDDKLFSKMKATKKIVKDYLEQQSGGYTTKDAIETAMSEIEDTQDEVEMVIRSANATKTLDKVAAKIRGILLKKFDSREILDFVTAR